MEILSFIMPFFSHHLSCLKCVPCLTHSRWYNKTHHVVITQDYHEVNWPFSVSPYTSFMPCYLNRAHELTHTFHERALTHSSQLHNRDNACEIHISYITLCVHSAHYYLSLSLHNTWLYLNLLLPFSFPWSSDSLFSTTLAPPHQLTHISICSWALTCCSCLLVPWFTAWYPINVYHWCISSSSFSCPSHFFVRVNVLLFHLSTMWDSWLSTPVD